jgi:hypothetical protein
VSHRHSLAVWDDVSLTGNAKLLMLKFADNADEKTGGAYPGTAYLAEKTGISERQIKRLIPALVVAGKLAIVKDGGGRGNRTVYRVLPELHAKGDVATPNPATTGKGDIRSTERVTSGTLKGDIARTRARQESLLNHSEPSDATAS